MKRTTASLLLLGVALAWAAVQLVVMPRSPQSFVFHDELHYAQQARDVAEGGLPRYNRAWQPKYPPLYGMALAPVRALAGPEDFRWWSQVANLVFLLSAMIPAYRVARMHLSRGAAVAAAASSLLLPFQILVTWLQSEILLIPLFLWLVHAALRIFDEPTFGRGLLAGILVGLMILTKSLVVVLVPALVVAVVWSGRSLRSSLRPSIGIALGAAAIVLPWAGRTGWIPGEAAVPSDYSYLSEFSLHGLQTLAHYLYWVRAEPGCAIIALGAPVLVLGLALLFSWLRDPAPRRRGLACFLLLSAAVTSLLVSVWVAQVAYFAPKYQERYFLFLWPAFMLVFAFQIFRPGGGLRAVAAAVAVTGLMLLVMPDAFFDPDAIYINPFEFPSAQQIFSLAVLAGGAVGVRLLLAAPLLLLPWWYRRRAWAGVALFALVVVYQVRGVVAAYQVGLDRHRTEAARMQPILDWLEPLLAPGDAVVMHEIPEDVDHRIAMRFELDLNRVNRDLRPDWQSTLSLDSLRGRYDFRGVPPLGRLYMLTTVPGPPAASREWRFQNFRLIDLSGGFRSLGGWMDPPVSGSPTHQGVFADQWCALQTELWLPVSYPAWHEVVFWFHQPLDGPIRQSIFVGIRGPYGYYDARKLEPGGFLKMTWQGYVWSPVLHIVLGGERDVADDQGRRVAYQLARVELDPPGSGPAPSPHPGDPVRTGDGAGPATGSDPDAERR